LAKAVSERGCLKRRANHWLVPVVSSSLSTAAWCWVHASTPTTVSKRRHLQYLFLTCIKCIFKMKLDVFGWQLACGVVSARTDKRCSFILVRARSFRSFVISKKKMQSSESEESDQTCELA
jgi:hypothetical protein